MDRCLLVLLFRSLCLLLGRLYSPSRRAHRPRSSKTCCESPRSSKTCFVALVLPGSVRHTCVLHDVCFYLLLFCLLGLALLSAKRTLHCVPGRKALSNTHGTVELRPWVARFLCLFSFSFPFFCFFSFFTYMYAFRRRRLNRFASIECLRASID